MTLTHPNFRSDGMAGLFLFPAGGFVGGILGFSLPYWLPPAARADRPQSIPTECGVTRSPDRVVRRSLPDKTATTSVRKQPSSLFA
jgi:hypothetical protein